MLSDGVAIILELVDYKQKGNSHKWIGKMFDVQMTIIQGYCNEFIPELLIQLERLYDDGMDNYYLTCATNK